MTAGLAALRAREEGGTCLGLAGPKASVWRVLPLGGVEKLTEDHPTADDAMPG